MTTTEDLGIETLEFPTPEELKALQDALDKVEPDLDPGEEVTLEDLAKVTKELLAPVKE